MAEDRQLGHPGCEPRGTRSPGNTMGEDSGAHIPEKDHPSHSVYSAALRQHVVYGNSTDHP